MTFPILDAIDSQLLLLANSCHSDWADQFMMMFSGRFIWIPMYVALAFIIARHFSWKKALIIFGGLALAITMADQICATVIRPLACRLRPSNLDNPLSALVTVVDGYRGGAYGFPSCHASNSFALIVFVALVVARRRLTLFLACWAVVNSYSRLYLGVHYPGDLMAGALIGSLCGAVTAIGVRRAIGLPVGGLMPRRAASAPVIELPTPRRLMAVGASSIQVSDVAPAVGFATVVVMAAIAAI